MLEQDTLSLQPMWRILRWPSPEALEVILTANSAMMAEVTSEIRDRASHSAQRHLPPVGGRRWPLGMESTTERLLLILTVLGFIVPNVCVGLYLAGEGLDIGGYFSLWTASIPSTQLLLDLIIAASAFFIWAAVEGPRAQIKRWWLCIPASLLVGLCFGLPLFLLMRERALSIDDKFAQP